MLNRGLVEQSSAPRLSKIRNRPAEMAVPKPRIVQLMSNPRAVQLLASELHPPLKLPKQSGLSIPAQLMPKCYIRLTILERP